MLRFRIIFIVFVLSLVIGSCGWKTSCLEYRKNTSVVIGQEKTAVVGAEMVQKTFSTIQCIKTRYEPTGLNLTLFKREPVIVDDIPYDETVEKELLYAGIERNVLHITYREYTVKGMARTPFFQNLYYDLSISDKIVFQDWLIQVIDANNQKIVFKVINEDKATIR